MAAAATCGEGEHIWLDIEKNGANTAVVAQQLAEAAGVQDVDVGNAGLKDRYAITRQWFSIVLRDVTGERDDIEAHLEAIASQGVPDDFGAQR
ncbi:MAG: tRNA pseudouridine(13) synthase TruD [Burkholderiales bacterium]|nr:tRNA pseudouridine(13) synthase TruD [Burkholderiales bacterium]